MALIGVYINDPQAKTDVLYLSESHYLFNPKYSFVVLELLTLFSKDIRSFNAVIQGEVLSGDTLNEVRQQPAYKALARDYISPASARESSGVFDFSQTFSWHHSPTNKGYEGPQRETKQVGETLTIYATQARVKSYVASSATDSGITYLTVSLAENEMFRSDMPYALRLGAFIKFRKEGAAIRFRYPGNLFIDPQVPKITQSLQRREITLHSENVRLWLRTSQTKGYESLTKHLIETQHSQPSPDLVTLLNQPTTDMWIIVPKRWGITSGRPGVLSEPQEARFLLYKHLQDNLPYQWYHFQLAPLLGVPSYIDSFTSNPLPITFRINSFTGLGNLFLRFYLPFIINLSIPALSLQAGLSWRWALGFYCAGVAAYWFVREWISRL